jgi:hypothetical protein
MTERDVLFAALKRLVDQVGETEARPHDRDFSQAYSAAYDLVYGADEFTDRFMAQGTNK